MDDLLAVIEDEDKTENDVAGSKTLGGGAAAEVNEGRETGSGSTEGGSAVAGGGGSAAASGHARGEGARPTERKGPHCLMRLMGLLVEPDMRSRLIASGQQATRQQLDASDVGSSSSMWRTLAERFRNPTYEVSGGRRSLQRAVGSDVVVPRLDVSRHETKQSVITGKASYTAICQIAI